MREKVERAINGLDKHLRTALLLPTKYTYARSAAILGISKATLRDRVREAKREVLDELLGEAWEDAELADVVGMHIDAVAARLRRREATIGYRLWAWMRVVGEELASWDAAVAWQRRPGLVGALGVVALAMYLGFQARGVFGPRGGGALEAGLVPIDLERTTGLPVAAGWEVMGREEMRAVPRVEGVLRRDFELLRRRVLAAEQYGQQLVGIRREVEALAMLVRRECAAGGVRGLEDAEVNARERRRLELERRRNELERERLDLEDVRIELQEMRIGIEEAFRIKGEEYERAFRGYMGRLEREYLSGLEKEYFGGMRAYFADMRNHYGSYECR